MNYSSKYKIISIISIVLLCFGLTFKYLQNDTFYIIKLGNYIVNHGIDSIDHYSWVAKLPYTYPHWLYDIFIYYIYNCFSFVGVYISVIVMFIIACLIIYYIMLNTTKNFFLSFLVGIVSVFRLTSFAVARAQILSLSLFLLEVYFINKLINIGKNKYIIYLCILSLLIANIHGTAWLFYFVLFLPFIVEYFIYKIISLKKVREIYKLDRYKNGRILVEKVKNIKKVFISFLLCFLMGVFTPCRICYSYVFKVMLGDSQKVLLEHLPLVIIDEPFLIILIILLILVLIFTNVKIKLRELFMIGGLFLLSLMSIRHLLFFYSIGLIYIVDIIYRSLLLVDDYTIDILGNILINSKMLLLIVLMLIISFSGYKFYGHSKEEYVTKKYYPIDAVKYIKNNLDYKNIRLYNEYDYGSYLLFNDIPVFIDSRCDLYLKEFNGMKYSLFNEMKDIDFKYEKKFKKYNVSHVILNKHNSFYMTLVKDNNYNIIYQDRFFILFEVIDYE